MTDVLVAIVAAYALLLGLKLGLRSKGDLRTAGLLLAFAWIPLVALDRWWPNHLPSGVWHAPGKDVRYVDLAKDALLILVVTHAIVAASSWWRWRKSGEYFLALHRGVLKIGILLVLVPIALKLRAPEIEFGTLLASATVGSIILGLALQETLGNLFAGLSLEAENLYRKGEYIQIGDGGLKGIVVEKTWRSTRILTSDGQMVIVPNNKIAGEVMLNYDRPTPVIALRIDIGASYDDPPLVVKETLLSVANADPEVLDQPAPEAWTMSYGDFAINYTLRIWIHGYRKHWTVEDRIRTNIWYAFRTKGISIPFPIQTEHQIDYTELKQIAQERRDKTELVVNVLERNATFLASTTPSDRTFLAENAMLVTFEPGHAIVKSGERSDAVYFVRFGSCEVTLQDGSKRSIEQGNFFGEIGVLRGVPRTTNVVAGAEGAEVIRVGGEALLDLCTRRPELRAELDKTTTQRLTELRGATVDSITPQPPGISFGQLVKAALRALLPW